MSKFLKSALTALAALVLLYAAASIVGTLSLLADAADRVQPGAGAFVFWSLLALFGVLAATPVWLYLRLPKPLEAAGDDRRARLLGVPARSSPSGSAATATSPAPR